MSPACLRAMIQRRENLSSTECNLSEQRIIRLFGAVSALIVSTLVYPAVSAPDSAQELLLDLPLACTVERDCWVINFVDHDPASGATDFTCGPRSYDDHKGTDFGLLDRRAMTLGVDVLAAAEGTVRSLRDGMPDSGLETPADILAGRDCGNGVILDHAGGWSTQYCHMRRGSLAVTEGQTVARGQRLGLVGMSGRAEFPHLHITLRRHETVYDPYTGLPQDTPCGEAAAPFWAAQAGVAYRPFAMQSIGFASRPVDRAGLLADATSPASLSRQAEALVLWGQVFGVRRGDRLVFRIEDPTGQVFAERTIEIDKTQAYRMAFIGRRAPADGWPAGRYLGSVTLVRPGTDATVTRRVEVDLR